MTLEDFGGYLQCEICGLKRPLGHAGNKLSSGWPKCCGYTMRWYTRKGLEKMKKDEHGKRYGADIRGD